MLCERNLPKRCHRYANGVCRGRDNELPLLSTAGLSTDPSIKSRVSELGRQQGRENMLLGDHSDIDHGVARIIDGSTYRAQIQPAPPHRVGQATVFQVPCFRSSSPDS